MRVHVIACGVMREELARCRIGGLSFSFLEQGLHLTPANMRGPIQEVIDSLSGATIDRIVLVYGLCSNGTVGLRAGNHPLIMPRIHDCIPMLLGSVGKWREEQEREPGTFYLSNGFIRNGAAPLDLLNTYCTRMDREEAEWGLREQFKHYRRMVWIDTGLDTEGSLRSYAKRNAEFLDLAFEEMKGGLDLFERVVEGTDDRETLLIPPGGVIESRLFY